MWYVTSTIKVPFSIVQYTGEFGLIDVSWRSLAVGVITSILVLPINFLITLIFRRSKVSIAHVCTSICQQTIKMEGMSVSRIENCGKKHLTSMQLQRYSQSRWLLSYRPFPKKLLAGMTPQGPFPH